MTAKNTRFKITETVFTSPHTTIYRARYVEDNKKIIIKASNKEYPSFHEASHIRFEYNFLSRLDIPGVIKAYELSELNGNPVLILEDFDAVSLSDLSSKKLSLEKFLDIAINIAGTIGEIHHHNIIHKDINPSNILINLASQKIKIIDFNNATDLQSEKKDINTVNTFRGSLAYSSPEQTGWMNRDLDYRTDYYSLGVTCYELLTGILPFKAQDSMGYIHAHITKPIPDLRKLNPVVPDAVILIIQKLLEKSAEKRYQSAHGLIKDLEFCKNRWKEKGVIADFKPGEYDAPEKICIPKSLFSREEESERLLNVFNNAAEGSNELVFIAGSEGVGKSLLANEVRKEIITRHGYFLPGAFSQCERNIPYRAFIQAFKSLAEQLLLKSDSCLEEWRNKLQHTLGVNAGLVTEFVAEFEAIIGESPPPPKLGSKETKVRFHKVITDFIRLFAGKDHPTVICLDDLQWSDSDTLELLLHLLESNISHLMFIGIYRDSEMEEESIFQIVLNAIQKEQYFKQSMQTIYLDHLDRATIGTIISETFYHDLDTTAQLSDLIYQETKGNPFFTIELLNALNQTGAFHYQPDNGHWRCNFKKIEENISNKDVVAFLVHQFRQLPFKLQEILKLASCIGCRFELEVLSLISDKSLLELEEMLRKAIQNRILLPLNENDVRLTRPEGPGMESKNPLEYTFQHELILQAVNNLLGEKEKQEIHLSIGRSLLSKSDSGVADRRIFNPTNHLNQANDLILKQPELEQLVVLNQKAGNAAMQAAAHAIAADYYRNAVNLVKERDITIDQDILFKVSIGYADCCYQAGNIETAMMSCDGLLKLAKRKIDKASVYSLKARMLNNQGKRIESIDAIKEGLALLGIDIPKETKGVDRKLGNAIRGLQEHLGKTPIEDLVNLPQMKDEEKIVAMNLLFQSITAVVQTYPPLFILVELTMFDLAMTYGTTVVSCRNFVDCGVIVANIFGDYHAAYKFGMAANALIDKYQAVTMKPGVYFAFAGYVSHWQSHHLEGLKIFDRALKSALEVGDTTHLLYTYVLKNHRLLLIGRNLEDCWNENKVALQYAKKYKAHGIIYYLGAIRYAILKLNPSLIKGGQPNIEDFIDSETIKFSQEDNQSYQALNAHSIAFVSFILGDLEEAKKWEEHAAPFIKSGEGMFYIPEYHLIKCLIITKSWNSIPTDQHQEKLVILQESQDKLKTWADTFPANFAHKHFLVEAEVARVKKESMETVVGFYNQALGAIGEGEFIQMKALINELQGEFWLEQHQKNTARFFILEAHRLYEHWGANQKVNQLERIYFHWFVKHSITQSSPGAETTTSNSLDISSIVRSTQVVSQEIKMDSLQKKLIHAIMEYTGAQRGALVLKQDHDNGLYIAAIGEGRDIKVNRSIPLDETSMTLCFDVVNEVAYSQTELVLNDVQKDDVYNTNDYIKKRGVKSILCVPVIYQNFLKALLYLENNQVPNAFFPNHLTVLRVISSQAAISLENARIYKNLNEQVRQRTSELEAAQAELVENAHKVGMSDVASNILHNVSNTLNSLKTSGFVLKQTVAKSHIIDLNRANKLLEANRHDLNSFFLDNPKGIKLIDFYLSVGDVLKIENATVLEQVDRIQEGIETINDLIAAQQEYLYVSKFMELIDIRSTIESALAIYRSGFTRNDITVTTHFEEVPKIEGHKMKLMHVMVNLLKNAEDAILKGNEEQKCINIVVKPKNERILVQISDTGCGILEEDLTKIFSFGFSTKEESHGVGLHSTANYIAEMKGQIWAESKGKNQGATINITFPNHNILNAIQ